MNIEGKRSGEGFCAHKAILVNALSRALAERVVLMDLTIGRKGFLAYLKSLGGSNVVKVVPSHWRNRAGYWRNIALERELEGVLQVNINTVDGLLKDKSFKKKENSQLVKKIQRIKSSLETLSNELKKGIKGKDQILEPGKIHIDKKDISTLVKQEKNWQQGLPRARNPISNSQFTISYFKQIKLTTNIKKLKEN